MKRLFSFFLAFVFLTAQARSVFAQEPAPEPAPAPPPPQVAPAEGVQVVRVNFRSAKARATIFDRSSGRMLCVTPCTADVPVGAPLRVVLEGGEDEPHDFTITADQGSPIDLEIKRGGTGALVGGIVMAGVGGVLVLTGLVLIAVASSLEDERSVIDYGELADVYRAVGIAQTIIGAGLGVAGIIVLANRTNEATTRQRPAGASRAEMFRGDLAEATPRDPLRTPVAPQLGWTFHF